MLHRPPSGHRPIFGSTRTIAMAFYQIDELRRSASGRWAELLTAAGIPAAALDGRNHACPKCGGRDRFAAFADFHQRGAVHCRRCFTSGCDVSPSDGIATLRWWLDLSFGEAVDHLGQTLGLAPLHVRNDAPGVAWRSSQNALQVAKEISAEEIESHTNFARDAYARMDRRLRERLAESLMVTTAAIVSLRVGISADQRCSTWPMRNESGDVVGVRMVGLPWTDAAGAKWSRRGSQSGLFLSRDRQRAKTSQRDVTTVFVTEGASDTAAALSMGWNVIGRASCSSSGALVHQYVRRAHAERMIVVADNDDPGRSGGERLARAICRCDDPGVKSIRVITPPDPYKDLREWLAGGTNSFDLDDAQSVGHFVPQVQQTFLFS